MADDREEFLAAYKQLPEDMQRIVYRLLDRMARVDQGMARPEEIRAIHALKAKYSRGESLTLDDIYESLSDIPAQ